MMRIVLISIFRSVEHRYSLGSTAETYNDNASASRNSQQPMIPPLPQQDSLGAPRTLLQGESSLRGSSPSDSSDGLGGAAPVSGGSPYDDTEPIIPSYSRQNQESTPPSLRPGGSHYPQQGGTSYAGQSPQNAPYGHQPSAVHATQPTPAPRRFEAAEPLPPAQGLPRPSKPVMRRQSAQLGTSPTQIPPAPPTRGYTLTDPGVVNPDSSSHNVRRVSRNSKRSSTAAPGYGNAPSPPPSTSSHGGHTRRSTAPRAQLPPGAAPPQYPRYGS
jgi:hypothetical protein